MKKEKVNSKVIKNTKKKFGKKEFQLWLRKTLKEDEALLDELAKH